MYCDSYLILLFQSKYDDEYISGIFPYSELSIFVFSALSIVWTGLLDVINMPDLSSMIIGISAGVGRAKKAILSARYSSKGIRSRKEKSFSLVII